MRWPGLLLASVLAAGAAEFPSQPVRVVVPFAPGGASDTFVRILQKGIVDHQLLPRPLVVLNAGGAGGTIGSRRVKDAEPDGHTILCLHDAILTARHFGNADYGPEAFAPVAATGQSSVVVAVAKNSPYRNLAELMDEASARPFQTVFGANLGAPSHYSGLLLQRAKPGAQFRFTQTGGGARRRAALIGGHIEVTGFSVSEYLQYRDDGMRALAVLSTVRHTALPKLPTAKEQGINVVHGLMQFWWAPKGTPPERVKQLAELLRQATQTDYVRGRLNELHIDPVFLTGDELLRVIDERTRQLDGIEVGPPPSLPPLPWLVLAGVLALGILAWREGISESAPPDWRLAAKVGVAVVFYVGLMQGVSLNFVFATVSFVAVLAVLLLPDTSRWRAIGAGLAIVMALGCDYVFKEILKLGLP